MMDELDLRDKLRDTLIKLMQEHRITEAELCRQAGVSPPTVNRLISRATDDPRILTIRPLARFFRVSIDQLIGDEPLDSIKLTGKHSLVPVIPWNQAHEWENLLKTINVNNWNEWNAMSIPVGANAYALKIPQRTLGMPFSFGTLIAVEPTEKPQDGDFVIVYDKESHSVSIKQIMEEGRKIWLKALNKTDALIMGKNSVICGVVIQSELSFKKD